MGKPARASEVVAVSSATVSSVIRGVTLASVAVPLETSASGKVENMSIAIKCASETKRTDLREDGVSGALQGVEHGLNTGGRGALVDGGEAGDRRWAGRHEGGGKEEQRSETKGEHRGL